MMRNRTWIKSLNQGPKWRDVWQEKTKVTKMVMLGNFQVKSCEYHERCSDSTILLIWGWRRKFGHKLGAWGWTDRRSQGIHTSLGSFRKWSSQSELADELKDVFVASIPYVQTTKIISNHSLRSYFHIASHSHIFAQGSFILEASGTWQDDCSSQGTM